MVRPIIITDAGGTDVVRIQSGLKVTNGSTLIVPAGTIAYFVMNGVVSPPFRPGKYVLNTGVSPFFAHINNIMTRGEIPQTVSVFYISPNVYSSLQTGIGDILYRESQFNLSVDIKGSIYIEYNIANPEMFLSKLVGMYNSQFDQEDFIPKIEKMVQLAFKEVLSRVINDYQITELNTNLSQLSNNIFGMMQDGFDDYGLNLLNVRVQGLNISPQDLERIRRLEDTRAEGELATDLEKNNIRQIYGDIGTRTMAEFITGTARGNATSVNTGGGNANSFANMYAQMMMMMILTNQMNGPFGNMMNQMSSFANNSSLFNQGTHNGNNVSERNNTEDDAPNAAPRRHINRVVSATRSRLCRNCGSRIAINSLSCPICKVRA